ncbi:hypothetical protein V6N13_095463 [Hibiscus sabdariffa]|uniref:Uncharacterized protein n=2 Tax=Hibiscus sabdariffa TaxID=183260 RepID=A0ABR2PRZ8_9ROSI
MTSAKHSVECNLRNLIVFNILRMQSPEFGDAFDVISWFRISFGLHPSFGFRHAPKCSFSSYPAVFEFLCEDGCPPGCVMRILGVLHLEEPASGILSVSKVVPVLGKLTSSHFQTSISSYLTPFG